jgi:hypothetical protein
MIRSVLPPFPDAAFVLRNYLPVLCSNRPKQFCGAAPTYHKGKLR